MNMPEPPGVNLFTRYVLENPWPLGAVLLIAGAWLLWSGLHEGLLKKVKIGAGVGGLGIVVMVTGWFVVTSGEHAKSVTRQLVNAAVADDPVAAVAMFSPDAVFTIGSPQNPGMGIQYIENQIVRLLERYKIESNGISMLRGFTESSDAATVHLVCFTTVNQFPYPNVSRWVLRVERQPEGDWKIARLTCVSINDQTPPSEGVR